MIIMDLSIVVPVLNEQRNITILRNRLEFILSKFKGKYEIIFVDDGSTDNTANELRTLTKEYKNVRAVSFTRNFGKSSALLAGFEAAKGNLILTMDGDLQDDPIEIPRFLSKLNEGYDIVVGWKYKRRDPTIKILLSKLFNAILRKVTKIKLHDCDNNFRLFKKEIIPHLNLYGGMYRYIPVFAAQKGFKVGELKVRHNPRRFGKSKYGLERVYKGFFDLMTLFYLSRFKRVPLYLFGGIGALLLGAGVLIGIYLAYIKFFMDQLIGNRPLLTLSILMMIVGLQFLFFGLLAEMFTNFSQKNNRNYVVKS